VVNKSTVRPKNKERFAKCVELRRLGFSYSEIREKVSVSKSTLQNWLTLAGLTLTKEHLEIQLKKSVEKRAAATLASKITRARKRDKEVSQAVAKLQKYIGEELFIYGIALYEAEGSKQDECRFSNSDWRLIKLFDKFIRTYFGDETKLDLKYSVFIHESRRGDLDRIKSFWSRKLQVPKDRFPVYWKKNKIVRKRTNKDYVGQIQVRVAGVSYLTRKLLAISDIIASQHL